MTNPAKKNTSEGSPQRPSDSSESDCQPRPSKRARPSPSAATRPSSSGCASASGPGLPPDHHGARTTGTGPLASARALGGRRLSSRRDVSDRSLTVTVSAIGEFRQTVDSDSEKETSSSDSTGMTGREGEALVALRQVPVAPARACPACSALPLDCSHTPPCPLALEGHQGKETTSCDRGLGVMIRETKLKTKNTSSIGKLDWVWSEEETSEACVHVLGNNGAQVFFHQDYSCGTAAARGTQQMSEGQHFWEIKMDSPVYGTAMMVGIGTKQINLGQYTHTFCNMLGSDTNLESCGLSYTGRFYQGGAHGRAYCSKFGQGTVIGLHLDMWFGTLTYYKNGKCLGVATKGLLGKVWHPTISSTAARSSMCLQTARSFPSTLQFWCCRTLRQAIPTEHSVLEVLDFPPGMRAFLEDNLMWLLDSHSRGNVDVLTKGTQTDLSMATHKLSEVPLIRRPSPDKGGEQNSTSPS